MTYSSKTETANVSRSEAPHHPTTGEPNPMTTKNAGQEKRAGGAKVFGIPPGMRKPKRPLKSEHGVNAGWSAFSVSCAECVRLGIRASSGANSNLLKDYATDSTKPMRVCPVGHRLAKNGWPA